MNPAFRLAAVCAVALGCLWTLGWLLALLVSIVIFARNRVLDALAARRFPRRDHRDSGEAL